MTTLVQDLRYALRMLFKTPGFTVVAVVTLALGIGANTAIFSVVNTVLLQSLPYEDPGRLMFVNESKVPQFPEFSVSPGNFLAWQNQSSSFEKLVAITGTSYILVAGDAEPERLRAARVSAGLFEMLGVNPEQGRTFTAEEDQPGASNVVILRSGLWKRRFAADPNIIGQSITLSGLSYTVIGIMPDSFPLPNRDTELWTPIAFTASQAQQHGSHYLRVIGRLNRDVTITQADVEMKAIAARLAEQNPGSNAGWSTNIFPLQEYEVRDIKSGLFFLLGAVALVLLIACANVANLLLARSSSRQKEMAIRSALGASRRRVIRQLLTESVLLAVLGGVVGLLLAYWGTEALLALAPENLPRIKDVALDGGVLGFTLVLTLVTGVVFGLAPALQASSPNLNETLKEAGRGTSSGRHRVRSGLVIVEVALALMLLVCSGLMIRSFVTLQRVNPGFNQNSALAVDIALPGRKYQNAEQRLSFFTQLLERTSALPGVVEAGVTHSLPILDDYLLGFRFQGRPPAPPGEDRSTIYYAVSPGYFKAMGIPLLRGRYFTEQDSDAHPVAIINEAMAKTYFPDEDPIGQAILVTQGPDKYREIVGIVGDVKQYGLARPATWQTYEPFRQMPFSAVTLVVRTENNPMALSTAIRSEVLAIDREQPVSRIQTLDQVVSGSVQKDRFLMLLLGVFGAVALILAAVGLYGVMNYSVNQRTHEIGIRMALGASGGNVLKLIVGHGMMLTAIGVASGLAGAFAVTRVMATLLYEISATDPLTFAGIAVLLSFVALVACLAPARRAIKVDPMRALRHE